MQPTRRSWCQSVGMSSNHLMELAIQPIILVLHRCNQFNCLLYCSTDVIEAFRQNISLDPPHSGITAIGYFFLARSLCMHSSEIQIVHNMKSCTSTRNARQFIIRGKFHLHITDNSRRAAMRPFCKRLTSTVPMIDSGYAETFAPKSFRIHGTPWLITPGSVSNTFHGHFRGLIPIMDTPSVFTQFSRKETLIDCIFVLGQLQCSSHISDVFERRCRKVAID